MGVRVWLSNRQHLLNMDPLRTLLTTVASPKITNIFSPLVLLSLAMRSSEASVATGYGRLNPGNPLECVDPDSLSSHPLGQPWQLPGVCGQAHCEKRGNQVYIFYAFCGSAHAEAPCYLSKTDLSLPYPYCCPRSVCPARDIQTNEINTDDSELQMAADGSWSDSSVVRVAPPPGFNRHTDTHSHNNNKAKVIDIVTYDTAEDGEDFDYSESSIDWSSFISKMPSPLLLE